MQHICGFHLSWLVIIFSFCGLFLAAKWRVLFIDEKELATQFVMVSAFPVEFSAMFS